ncbi:3-hydroxyacyl-CoA dehydrogenase family protein [Streptomyces solisilvae]|uniref:3-hydroxyacyl-CoA dehydrogenase family protein n=1 Tax=Streptomyces malaysiensis TaxID=92644 RepID=UPI0036A660F6
MTPVGVVGAGVMGTGVAQALAASGQDVVLVDLREDVLARARDEIGRICRLGRLMGGASTNPQQALDRITTSVDHKALSRARIVIENITEDWEGKRRLYQEIDSICDPECIFVANTSAIPVTRIAAATGRPDRVVGVHFMNPVYAKPAVELIAGHHTSPNTLDQVRGLLAEMGKKAIEVNDACGFVSNRVLMLTVNEAAYLVYEGTATAHTVDEVFRSCFGHPMGPLETADLIGVDTILRSIEVLYKHYADTKYRPCPLLKHMYEAGLHGRKSGEGFYEYQS